MFTSAVVGFVVSQIPTARVRDANSLQRNARRYDVMHQIGRVGIQCAVVAAPLLERRTAGSCSTRATSQDDIRNGRQRRRSSDSGRESPRVSVRFPGPPLFHTTIAVCAAAQPQPRRSTRQEPAGDSIPRPRLSVTDREIVCCPVVSDVVSSTRESDRPLELFSPGRGSATSDRKLLWPAVPSETPSPAPRSSSHCS